MTSHQRLAQYMAPRIVRFRDAPFYVGMDRRRLNVAVRPYLTELPIGIQGVGFDGLELDAWMDAYKAFKDRRRHKIRRSDARNCGFATGQYLFERQLSAHFSNAGSRTREVCS